MRTDRARERKPFPSFGESIRRGTLVTSMLLGSACAHVDTGQIDYRVADEPTALTDRSLVDVKGGRCEGSVARDCDPLLPARVIRRYMPAQDGSSTGFKAPAVYSIEIEQGMIGSNVLEGKVLGHQFGKKAEIAILANVFEFAGQASDAATRRFLEAGEYPGKADDPSDIELKLVYFGDDIQRGQTFNFSNIPLRQRSEYAGGSIGIQIVIMEVDAQAGPISSLLKTLARFGQQIVPGPGEVKDMLFDLGESLLSGSQDDKLFEYRFVLSAEGDNPRAVQATFAPGRYVLMRKQQRSSEMNWASLRLDHNTARLFQKSVEPSSVGGYSEVRDDLYLVLNVRRYPSGTQAEFYTQQDWSGFRNALQLAADTRAAPLKKVTEDIEALLGKERSANWGTALGRKWAVAEDRLDLYSARFVADFTTVDVSPCGTSVAELERRRDAAERDAEDALRGFITDYREAIAAPVNDASGKSVGKEFRDADRERLASRVATYFMPWTVSGADISKFKDAAAFEAAFADAGGSPTLQETALVAARSKAAATKSCSALLLR